MAKREERQGRMGLESRTYRFTTSVSWQGPHCNGEASAPSSPGLPVSCPPEFGGDPELSRDRWSPEHLLLSSVETCLMATFTDMSSRRRLPLRAYQSTCSGDLAVVERTLRFVMIRIHVCIVVETSEKTTAARTLLRDAAKRCPVSASLSCPVEITSEIFTR